MVSYIQSVSGRLAEAVVPEVIRNSVKGMLYEITATVDQIYKGPIANYPTVGTDFLKSRAFFPHQSKLKLAHQLLFYGIISGVGALIATAMSPFVGSFTALGSGFFAFGSIREYREGSQLKKAITELLDVKEITSDNLKNKENVQFDDKKQVVTFQLTSDKNLAFYVGSGVCPKGINSYMVANQVTEIWKKLNPDSLGPTSKKEQKDFLPPRFLPPLDADFYDGLKSSLFRNDPSYNPWVVEVDEISLNGFKIIFHELNEEKKQEFFELALKYHRLDLIKVFFENGYSYPFKTDPDSMKGRKIQFYDFLINKLKETPKPLNGAITQEPVFHDYYKLKGIVQLFLDEQLIEQSNPTPNNPNDPSKPFGLVPQMDTVFCNMFISPEFNVDDISPLFGQEQSTYDLLINELFTFAKFEIEQMKGSNKLVFLSCKRVADNYHNLPEPMRKALNEKLSCPNFACLKERFFNGIPTS